MNISIELPSELEKELSTEASRLKLSLTEYILHILSLRTSLSSTPKTGAELVAYWESVGVIDSRSDITDSQEYARKLRYEAEVCLNCGERLYKPNVVRQFAQIRAKLKNQETKDFELIGQSFTVPSPPL